MVSNTSQEKGSDFSTALIGSAVVWALAPIVLSIWWFFVTVVFGGYGGMQQDFWLSIHSAANTGGAAFWVWVLICTTVTCGMFIAAWMGDSYEERGTGLDKLVVGITALIVVFSLFMAINSGINESKDASRYYSSATTFYAPNLNSAPASLNALMRGATKSPSGNCDLVGAADVKSCIKQGSLPEAGFYPRVSSLAGAQAVMQRTSGSAQNVDLLENTITYLNGNGKNGIWSGIRDGQGAYEPTEGVVEWTGSGNPTECYFKGNDRLNVAIQGTKMNSLTNRVHRAFPNYYWTDSDVWGYCSSAGHPILVFPVTQQVTSGAAVVSAPAGVITVSGSPSGNPVIRYNAHPTHLPGPVYPETIAAAQRVASNWAAGRANQDRGLFGFEPTSSSANSTNVSEYLLKSKADGHDYWVTPLTLVNSQSQLFVAYSMVRADEVTSGHLNALGVYTLDNGDIRKVNIDSLEASAKEYVAQQDPGFFSSGGQLIEYTPTVGDVWRALGELNGRVVYRLDISATNQVSPNLVSLENYNGTGTGAGSTPSGGGSSPSGNNGAGSSQLSFCGQPVSGLTQHQIVECAKLFAQNLH